MNTVETLSKVESRLRARLPSRWRHVSSRMLWLATGGAVLCLILIISWLLGGPGAPLPSPPPPVRVATAQVHDVPVIEHTIGTVLANATVQVKSLVDGQLLSASFKEGQLVKTGDVLFQIEPKPFEDALHQAEGALAHDEATLASNQADLARYMALAKAGAVSTQLRDQTAAQVKSLSATVTSDKAAVDKAKFDLSNTQIRSPIDGKTGPILIQPGNLIKAQDTNSLVVITQIQPVKVSFSLPQNDLPISARQDARERASCNTELPQSGGCGSGFQKCAFR